MARRITIDLTDAADAEIERLTEVSGQTRADLFRTAVSLLRLHIDAAQRGQAITIDRKPGEKAYITLPFGVNLLP